MELINAKEKRVLGALNKLGDSPISRIAQETLINRTALYHTVEGLLSKGLITKIHKEGGAYFQPLPLAAYENWAKKQIAAVESQAQELKQWLAHQNKQQVSLYADIRYYEGFEGVKHLYADSWRDNADHLIYAITDYDRAYTTLGDFLENEYFPYRVKKGIKVKSLLPIHAKTGKQDMDRAQALLRDMRFIDLFENLGIELNVYGDKVAIIAFDEEKPSGVIIKNVIIAQAFKNIFEFLWKHSQKKP